jgi:hypothetical protein
MITNLIEIEYIKNKDIDRSLWDKCIARSINGNSYAWSWYLDAVCQNWDALVYGKYLAVMPLPLKRFSGIQFYKQPHFLNKTNIYITGNKDIELFPVFIESLKKHFHCIRIVTGNENLKSVNNKYKEIQSYKLDLIPTYQNITAKYSDGFKDEIEKIRQKKIFFNTGLFPKGIGLLAGLSGKLSSKAVMKLGLLSSVVLRKKSGEIYGAFNKNNRLIAAALFVSSHYKTNIVYVVQSKEAIKDKAVYGLINHYIKLHAEKALTLDFFGLKFLDPGFFESIGAVSYPLYKIKIK